MTDVTALRSTQFNATFNLDLDYEAIPEVATRFVKQANGRRSGYWRSNRSILWKAVMLDSAIHEV